MEQVPGDKKQDWSIGDGVFVFSASFGLSVGSPSAWTDAMTYRLFAIDVDRSRILFKLHAVEIPTKNDHLDAFILSKIFNESLNRFIDLFLNNS
jgi:hypothetical protein